jgi:hypothetical protein
MQERRVLKYIQQRRGADSICPAFSSALLEECSLTTRHLRPAFILNYRKRKRPSQWTVQTSVARLWEGRVVPSFAPEVDILARGWPSDEEPSILARGSEVPRQPGATTGAAKHKPELLVPVAHRIASHRHNVPL